MQRKGPQRGLGRDDLEYRHPLKTIPHAADLFGAGQLAEIPDDHRALLRGLAAEAGIGAHAVFAFFQRRRKPQRHHDVQPLATGVQHTDAGRRRMEFVHHPFQKTTAQGLDVVGLVQKGRHAVERTELTVLTLEFGSFLAHVLAQVLVQALQLAGHVVEALGHHAQLIGIGHRNPHGKITLRHAANAVVQRLYGPDDPAIQQKDHRQRAQAGHDDQHALRATQSGGVAGIARFEHAHQPVGLIDEAIELVQVGPHIPIVQGLLRQLRHGLPAFGNGLELLANGRIGRQEEGPSGYPLGKAAQNAPLLLQVVPHIQGGGLHGLPECGLCLRSIRYRPGACRLRGSA